MNTRAWSGGMALDPAAVGRRQWLASQAYLMSSRPMRDPTSKIQGIHLPEDVEETGRGRIGAIKGLLTVFA